MSQDAAGSDPPSSPFPAQNAPGVWPPPPMNQPENGWGALMLPFNDTASLALWVMGFLTAHIVLDTVAMPIDLLRANEGLIARGLVAVLQGLVLFVTGILFFTWAYRSYKNLTAFGATGLRMTPGWVVAYFFIPILNLFRPYTAFKEIWKGSTLGWSEGDDRAWKSAPASPLVLGWWLLWLLKNMLENVIALATRDEAQNSFIVWLNEGDHIISIAAGICAVLVVQRITARQVAKWKEIMARQPAMSFPFVSS